MKATVNKLLRLCMPILLVSLLLALFSGSALAEEADPGDTWWSLDPETGVLSVDGDVPQSSYWLGIYPPWYEWKDSITEVRFSEKVEYIGDYGFCESTNLTRVTLPSTLTYIGEFAFAYCEKLTSVTIPTKVETIKPQSFEGCDSLSAFHVDKDNPYFTSDSQGVLYTKNMTELVICPGGFTGTLVIPNGVKTLADNSVATCAGMTEVLIPDSVTRIGWGALADNIALTHISLPDSVEFVDRFAFAYCTNLKTVDLAKANLDSMDAFERCESLERITVSRDNSFFTCDNQGALYDKNMTSIFLCPSAFQGKFIIPQGVEIIYYNAFQSCIGLTTVEIPNSVKEIYEYAFHYCSSIEKLQIPESVIFIGNNAFSYCVSLTEISFREGLLDLGSYTFEGCTSLESVTLPNSITYLGNDVFAECTSLKTVRLPNTLKDIPYRTFSGCTALETISLPDKLCVIGESAFEYCASLKEILLPYSLETIGSSAFFGCSSLKTVSIPNSVSNMGWSIFYNCEELTSVVLPESFTYDNIEFWGCPNLTDIYFRGPAPVSEFGYVPDHDSNNLTLYYIEGQAGWTSPLWNGYNTKTWSGYVATDVSEEDYYYTPVQWALTEGITTGVGKDFFCPENTCTRAQVVTFLWRANGCPEPTTENNPFTDISPKEYYYKAVLWAAEQGITTGMTRDRFAPEEGCTRAQVVTFLWRAKGKPQADATQNPFTDVAEDTYYSQAVLWAVDREITNGKSKDRFAPEDQCTRGQVVTFLWRAKDPVPDPYAPYYTVLQDIQEKYGEENPYGRGLLYDLDGNGIEELILIYRLGGEYCAVYTIEDGNAVPLVEDHIFAYVVDGNRAKIGLAEIDGQLYFYSQAVYYEMGHDDTYQYMDYWGVNWNFYLPSESGLSLATKVELDYVMGSNNGDWVAIPEKCSFTVNGEEMPPEDYTEWEYGVNIIANLDVYSGCGYPLEELLTP